MPNPAWLIFDVRQKMEPSGIDREKRFAGVALAVIALALTIYFISQAHYLHAALSAVFALYGLDMTSEGAKQKEKKHRHPKSRLWLMAYVAALLLAGLVIGYLTR